jgi:hypothetical protein
MQRLHPMFYISLLELYYVRPGYDPRLVLMLLKEGEYNKTNITLGDHYKIKKIIAY